MGFSHPGLQHLVKFVPGLGNLNKICIKELPKMFEGVNFHKGLGMEISQLQSSTSVKGTIFWTILVNNPFDCVIVWEDSLSHNNDVDSRISNSSINELVILKV